MYIINLLNLKHYNCYDNFRSFNEVKKLMLACIIFRCKQCFGILLNLINVFTNKIMAFVVFCNVKSKLSYICQNYL